MNVRRMAALASAAAAVAGVVLALPAGADASTAPASFVAQAEAAGLDWGQAHALQAKVDDYLVKLHGRGTQVSPNQIDMHGAMLTVTVPGEAKPRQLSPNMNPYQECYEGIVDEGYFCAYQYQMYNIMGGDGDYIAMWGCGNYTIPWGTTGSWINDQTPGTRPLLTFTSGATWRMPAAPSAQEGDVNWSPVSSIRNC